MMFCLRVYLFLTYCFISSVLIITMIRSFSFCVYCDVGIDVSSTLIGYFRSCIRTMMYSGLWNSWSNYCFSFLINFLYWSLDSLYSAVVTKTAQKSSTSPLKFRIYDLCDGRLKRLPRPPCTW